MTCPKTLVCLMHEHVTNLPSMIRAAEKASYNMVIGPVTHPQFWREFNEDRSMAEHHKIFTRSDLLLSANDWMLKYIMQLSPAIDCDSSDRKVREWSERMLHQELTWSKHLVQNGCFVIRVPHGSCVNLVRHLNKSLDGLGCILVHVPWTSVQKERNSYRARDSDRVNDDEGDPWHDWNRFRRHCDFNKRIKLILEITHDFPSADQLDRWMGEPIEMIIFPHSLFIWSRLNATFYLSSTNLDICERFLRQLNVHVAIKCPVGDCNSAEYAKFFSNLANKVYTMRLKQMTTSFANDDRLILSAHETNQIDFGKNVNVTGNRAVIVKAYAEALALAMQDLARQSAALSILIVGPGCSELLPIVLTTSMSISQKVNVFIYDEDARVIHQMEHAIRYFYPNKGIRLISSRKRPQLNGKMHIIVSMPFESIYHSQWLQLNFDCVKQFLRSDGLVIPQQSKLSIAPIMSSKIHNKIRHGEILVDNRNVDVFAYETRSQTIYKVFPQNFYECATPKVAFLFEHRPDRRQPFCVASETELSTMTFDAKLECMVVGFFGYFEATLYRHIEISNQKMDRLNDIVCPALTFYPLATPQHLLAEQSMDVIFRLCFDANRHLVWYEWSTHKPLISAVHNFMGQCNRMSFKQKDRSDDDDVS